ncbi:helix-turn-helix domain-containing protein [Xanthomonas axonopodis]|uniref:helix-turn-helix domain-containing protein n=1 Tax=Xanthomonas axonopodis TaxID=53413 RepID=UPI0035581250
MEPTITYRDLLFNTYRVRRVSRIVKNGLMAFSDNLKRLRLTRGMTQEQLALACGWSGQSRIANYESSAESAREPKVSDVPLIAAALGVSVAELFGEASSTSHVERLDFGTISATVTVLRNYLELMGKPVTMLEDEELLEIAHSVVQEFGGNAPTDKVLDLTKILADRVRGVSVEQRQIRRIGKATSG